MTLASISTCPRLGEPHLGEPCGRLGDAGTRLLAGPPETQGAESFAHHVERLGALDLDPRSSEELRSAIAESGLQGRGGGQFPIAAKLEMAASSPGVPLVVVNGTEGEPASRKDRTLLANRPHLILDGAMVAARAVGANEVVLYVHRSRLDATAALEQALAERRGDSARVRIIDAPMRYVAGESSAVVSYLDGAGALPRRRTIPVAASGVSGRPTVVNNVETIAHLGLIQRFGPAWFAEAGDDRTPGSTLITVAGDLAGPPVVAEILSPTSIGNVLSTVADSPPSPRAVLIGGYEGTWIDGEVAMRTPLSRGALAACGASLGCGLIALLGSESCGLTTTARLVRWLAGESSGQCGPCVVGLPMIADVMDALAGGTAHRRDVRRLRLLAASVHGRGGCGHPTGVAGLVDSALDTFALEVTAHLRGRACRGQARGFPLPARETS